jgi:hypothetical protein
MFFINLFYNTQDIHKILIQKSYDDIVLERNTFNNKYPNFKGYLIGEEQNKLNEETKKDWKQYVKKIEILKQILINNILNYCKNYPNSCISKNRFINEYEEYPYRLEQCLGEVILEL